MSPWLAVFIGAVIGFAIGYVIAGRLSEPEYDAKLRADWNDRQRVAAEARLAELQEAN